MPITGAQLFVKALKEENVDTLFAYPGGTAIDLFDALWEEDSINVVLPRHEQALVHAADGYARSTGKVGVCLVTSGPGATNLVTGIATANYDSVPLVCFTGQVATSLIGNDAFQEVDIVGITRSITKYSVTVRHRDDLAETIKKAFYIARSGRPGVVLVDIPKDVQLAYGHSDYPKDINIRGYKPNTTVHLGQIKKALSILNKAKKPVFLIGGGVNIAHAQEELTKLVELTNVPVITTIMGKGAIDTKHPLWVGNIGIHGSFAANTAIQECDVLFSIGTRFNDRITGKIDTFAPNATIIHVDIDPASISRNIKVDIPIVGDAKNAIEALLAKAKPLSIVPWIDEISAWKDAHPIHMVEEGMNPQVIMQHINDFYETSITSTDVGQNQLWATQFLDMGPHKKLLTSGGLGTMGYGLPAAIGAKIGNPNENCICIAGDGGFQMNLQEMTTAVVNEVPITIILLNNGYLGNVRQWQEMFYDKHYQCTCLRYRKGCRAFCNNPQADCPPYIPDFVKLAESFGAKGIRVFKEEEIDAALKAASEEKKVPTIIEFIIKREMNVLPMVKPGNPLSEMALEESED